MLLFANIQPLFKGSSDLLNNLNKFTTTHRLFKKLVWAMRTLCLPYLSSFLLQFLAFISLFVINFKNMNLQTSGKKLILIVDDDPLIQDTLENSLTTYNYNTLVANDGIEAIALYAQYRLEISVVLVDMMMPSLDGATTIRVLKAMNTQTSIVAMSGLSLYEINHFLNGINVDDFLIKPFTIQELLQVLQAIFTLKPGRF